MCDGCGQEKADAYDPESDVYYDAREVVCRGCAARHGAGNQEPVPGAKVYVVGERPPEAELGPTVN